MLHTAMLITLGLVTDSTPW